MCGVPGGGGPRCKVTLTGMDGFAFMPYRTSVYVSANCKYRIEWVVNIPRSDLIFGIFSNIARVRSLATISEALGNMNWPQLGTNELASCTTSRISALSSASAALRLVWTSSPTLPFCSKLCKAGLSSRIRMRRYTSVMARRIRAAFSTDSGGVGSICRRVT